MLRGHEIHSRYSKILLFKSKIFHFSRIFAYIMHISPATCISTLAFCIYATQYAYLSSDLNILCAHMHTWCKRLFCIYARAYCHSPNYVHMHYMQCHKPIHNHVPSAMLAAVINPLIKNRSANIRDSDNYRELTISSNFFKLFEYYLLPFLKELPICSAQFGHRSEPLRYWPLRC